MITFYVPSEYKWSVGQILSGKQLLFSISSIGGSVTCEVKSELTPQAAFNLAIEICAVCISSKIEFHINTNS